MIFISFFVQIYKKLTFFLLNFYCLITYKFNLLIFMKLINNSSIGAI